MPTAVSVAALVRVAGWREATLRSVVWAQSSVHDGMSAAQVWACGTQNDPPRRGGHFEYQVRPYPRSRRAVGDAEIEPI